MMWHWNAPANLINQPGKEWWRGFYTDATTFNLPAALANPGGSDYQLLLRDIDAIAVQLQKFEDAGVPVIWRPLHEAPRRLVLVGCPRARELQGLVAPDVRPAHQLPRTAQSHLGIHVVGVNGNDVDWYPGDDEVDMVGLDIYTEPTVHHERPMVRHASRCTTAAR